jgi:UDP-3-O-[3-hydroxymyristoyl] glucosamine N-acyltransferase
VIDGEGGGAPESGEGGATLTASDVVDIVGGRLVGDPAAVARRVAPVDRAGPAEVTFLANARYAPLLAHSRAAIVLVSPQLEATPGQVGARVVVENPHEAVLKLLPRLYRMPAAAPGVHPTVRIGRGATIGREVSLGPYVVIGDGAAVGDRTRLDAHVVLGDRVGVGSDCHLFPHVTVYSGTSLGSRVLVHSGARLGSDGFGYVFAEGQHRKIPHVGRCVIEDDVEIGANTTIDRGSIDDTVVGAGTKIDNLVQVGHNVRIGKVCLLMAQVGIAGSTRVGDGSILAGQVGVVGHLTLGKGIRLGAQSGVMHDVPDGETWSGSPARAHRQWLRETAALAKLAGLLRDLERLIEERG